MWNTDRQAQTHRHRQTGIDKDTHRHTQTHTQRFWIEVYKQTASEPGVCTRQVTSCLPTAVDSARRDELRFVDAHSLSSGRKCTRSRRTIRCTGSCSSRSWLRVVALRVISTRASQFHSLLSRALPTLGARGKGKGMWREVEREVERDFERGRERGRERACACVRVCMRACMR